MPACSATIINHLTGQSTILWGLQEHWSRDGGMQRTPFLQVLTGSSVYEASGPRSGSEVFQETTKIDADSGSCSWAEVWVLPRSPDEIIYLTVSRNIQNLQNKFSGLMSSSYIIYFTTLWWSSKDGKRLKSEVGVHNRLRQGSLWSYYFWCVLGLILIHACCPTMDSETFRAPFTHSKSLEMPESNNISVELFSGCDPLHQAEDE